MPQSPVTRRMHERVHAYWQDLKGGRLFPAEEEIEPHILANIWDWCFITDMKKGSVNHGFHYTHMGPQLEDAYGRSMIGIAHCDASTAPHIASMLAHFNEIVESGEAAIDESVFENICGKTIKYRCCLLPLGRNRVEYILGCMRWKLC